MKGKKRLSSGKKSSAGIIYLQAVFCLAPFLTGAFHEAFSALLSVLLLIGSLFFTRQRGITAPKKNAVVLSAALLTGAYLITAVWAVDRGAALFGFVKFFPLLPWTLLISGLGKEDRKKLTDTVPLSAAAMTLITFLMSLVPSLREVVVVSGRLSGFFQYSNTFAVWLLAGLILCIYSDAFPLPAKAVFSVVLTGGILLSGSRSVFVLTALCAAVFLLTVKNKRVKLTAGVTVAVCIAGGLVYAAISGGTDVAGRFLNISFSESTFLGRLLYWKDALPVIAKHPFGLGYLGYYFTQQSFQTGVYSVMYIHNELLQLLLDIGWLPTAFLIYALGRSVLSKELPFANKFAGAVIVLHSLFDFDLQFLSVFMLLYLLSDCGRGEALQPKRRIPARALLLPVCIFSVYIGLCNSLLLTHHADKAVSLCPFYTYAKTELLASADDIEVAAELAESILKQNSAVAQAYESRGIAAISRGETAEFIENENAALDNAPYDIEIYKRYASYLITLGGKFLNSGDAGSARICLGELNSLTDRLDEVKRKTSGIAWKTDDAPVLELPEQLMKTIRELSSALGGTAENRSGQ